MTRIVLERVGGTDDCPHYAPRDLEDLRPIKGQNNIVCEVMGERAKRTTLQNKAIHLYCSLLSDAFNDAGLDMLTVLKVKSSTSWTMLSVKDVIWRSIQEAMFPEKTSTTQLETGEVSQVYTQIAKHLSENFNITQSFPNRFHE
jgi:hypothetical protein